MVSNNLLHLSSRTPSISQSSWFSTAWVFSESVNLRPEHARNRHLWMEPGKKRRRRRPHRNHVWNCKLRSEILIAITENRSADGSKNATKEFFKIQKLYSKKGFFNIIRNFAILKSQPKCAWRNFSLFFRGRVVLERALHSIKFGKITSQRV